MCYWYFQQICIGYSFERKKGITITKSDVDKLDIDKLKNVASNLSNLKNKVGKEDFDKLVPVLVYLSKLRVTVKNDVVKKDVHSAKKKNIEDKIPNITI